MQGLGGSQHLPELGTPLSDSNGECCVPPDGSGCEAGEHRAAFVRQHACHTNPQPLRYLR